MKSRLSYFLISGIILLLIFTGTFIWRNNHLDEAPKSNKKSFTAPVSSRYIPTNADLVFHWKINPTLLPKYIENYQDKVNKSITNKKTKLVLYGYDSFTIDYNNSDGVDTLKEIKKILERNGHLTKAKAGANLGELQSIQDRL